MIVSVFVLESRPQLVEGSYPPPPPILWRPPLYCLPPSFSNFVQPSPLPPPFPVTSNSHPHCLFCCLVWLSGAILLNDVMDLHMLSLRTIVHVLCDKVSSSLSSDTVWFFAGTLIWSHAHKHKHTHKDTQHAWGAVDWHTHINIYLHLLLGTHSSYLYYTLNE